MILSPEGVSLKILSKPRLRFFGAALLLLLVLSACGAPIAGESWPGISTDGKYIYVADKDNVFRINPAPPPNTAASTRSIEWLAKVPGGAHAYGAPAIGPDKTLYVGAYDHKVYTLSQNTSQPKPAVLGENSTNPPADRFIAGGLLKDGVFYIGMGDHGLKAYNTQSGNEKWTFSDTKYGVWSTPILEQGTLYFGSLDHFLYALDPEVGTLKWKLDLGGAIAASPLYDNGVLYIGTFNNELVSVSIENHKVLKRFTAQGWVWSTPTLKDGVLYFGDLSGIVYALDEKTLDQKWAKSYPDYPGGVRGSPAVVDVTDNGKTQRIVVVGSENKHLMAFYAADGGKVWTNGISNDVANDQILSDPIVIGDDVIVTTLNDNQVILAYNIHSSQKSWSVDLNAENERLKTATSIPLGTEEATAAATAAATEQK
jgi:outer membrane protein assembly factor BamB